uniref:RNase NYN domain-containing protein n=1 Tax=Panagrolaimus superbus TaxID=310955 RepID=A0A914Y6E1_9BILA
MEGALSRLILIDAANFMTVFKKVLTDYASPYERRKNAFHIIPVVEYFVSRGYTVRVCVADYALHSHGTQCAQLLKELKAMGLIAVPLENGRERDDRAMLACAADYGAIVLSCDKFRNHPDFKKITNRYVVGYERQKCSPNPDVTNNFGIECNYIFRLEGKSFFALPSDSDYANVQKSHKDFPAISPENLRRLELMAFYLQCDICSKIGASLPEGADFLDPEKSFPTNFYQFEKAANRRP